MAFFHFKFLQANFRGEKGGNFMVGPGRYLPSLRHWIQTFALRIGLSSRDCFLYVKASREARLVSTCHMRLGGSAASVLAYKSSALSSLQQSSFRGCRAIVETFSAAANQKG